MMDKDYANFVTGGLSTPSKMPGYSFSIPAEFCNVGSKLREIKGSVCSSCYACKGFYGFSNVQSALANRMLNLYHPDWVEAMAFLINSKKSRHFRWFDSGDIQDMQNLLNIIEVCKLTPDIQHWLPTRETGLISKYLAENTKPSNLVIRNSAMMVGQKPKRFRYIKNSSTVGSGKGWKCPASTQDNKCGDCRACWNPKIKNIDYVKH